MSTYVVEVGVDTDDPVLAERTILAMFGAEDAEYHNSDLIQWVRVVPQDEVEEV